MARRTWVIGAAGVAVVALAAATSSSGGTAATSTVTSIASAASAATDTPPPISSLPITAPLVTDPPSTTAPPTTDLPTTEAPSTSTTSSTTTSTTSPSYDGPFNGKAFDDVVAAATVAHGDISAGVAVIRGSEVLHTGAFGMENPFESKPATTRTRFRIASVSKMLTAVAVMQLVADGSIELDKPFAGQLGLDGPFTDPRVAAVTVRQLMSHTSGFAASRNIFFGHGVDTWQQAANNALGQVLQFDPGTGFQYSNTNFCLLGMLLESVTGQPFETAIRERVLKPVGAKAHLAPTFDTQAGDALHASATGRNYMEVLGPAGGWVATPLDVAKLASALREASTGASGTAPDATLLDQASVAAMRVPVPVPVEDPPPLDGWSYGLGLILFGDGSWGHTGTIESTHAIVVNRPDGLTIAVLVSGKVPDNTDDLLAVIDLAVAAAATP